LGLSENKKGNIKAGGNEKLNSKEKTIDIRLKGSSNSGIG
jgi:hypothetical protein